MRVPKQRLVFPVVFDLNLTQLLKAGPSVHIGLADVVVVEICLKQREIVDTAGVATGLVLTLKGHRYSMSGSHGTNVKYGQGLCCGLRKSMLHKQTST